MASATIIRTVAGGSTSVGQVLTGNRNAESRAFGSVLK
jgi:hypothetical protein